MKKLFCILSLFMLLSPLLGQRVVSQLDISSDTTINLNGETWIYEGQQPFCIIPNYRVVFENGTLITPRTAFRALKNQKYSSRQQLIVRDLTVKPHPTIVFGQNGESGPRFIDCAPNSGAHYFEVENVRVEHMAGSRFREMKHHGSHWRLIVRNSHLGPVNGLIWSNGKWKDPQDAKEEQGGLVSGLTRSAIQCRNNEDVNMVGAVLIEYNTVFNVDTITGQIYHGTDVISVASNSKVKNGIIVRGNLVVGNYQINNKYQFGCAFIIDAQKTTVLAGGYLFEYNVAVNGSNRMFQAAAYGPGTIQHNYAVSTGLQWTSDIKMNGRKNSGFGLYHNNPSRQVSDDIRFFNNKALVNGKFGDGGYSLKKIGGGKYPDYFIPFSGENANITLYPNGNATHADEILAIREYFRWIKSLGIVQGPRSGGGGDPDPGVDYQAQINNLKLIIDNLNAQLQAQTDQIALLEQSSDQLQQQLSDIQSHTQETLKYLVNRNQELLLLIEN